MIVLARDVHMPVVAEMIRLGSGFLCVTIDPDEPRNSPCHR